MVIARPRFLGIERPPASILEWAGLLIVTGATCWLVARGATDTATALIGLVCYVVGVRGRDRHLVQSTVAVVAHEANRAHAAKSAAEFAASSAARSADRAADAAKPDGEKSGSG